MILVFGEQGQLAQTFKTLRPEFHYVSQKTVNFTHPEQITPYLDKLQPSVVINTSAYTAVDKAEAEQELAQQINGIAPQYIAQWCKKNSSLLIHFSTDYVFDGQKKLAYLESDPPHPLSTYGKTKLKGEQFIQSSGCPYFIFRTSWVFSPFSQNFLKTMLRLGKEKDILKVVNDQRGSPTYTFELAKNILPIIDNYSRWLSQPTSWGVYHLTGKETLSWYDFAKKIFSLAPTVNEPLKIKDLQAITTAEYPTPAQRPQNSQLNMEKFNNLTIGSFETLDNNIKDCLRRLHGYSKS